MIKVFTSGAHARRTPLSHPALAPLFAESVALVQSPQEADLYVFAHAQDIETAPQALIGDWRTRHRPVVLLSEDPLQDTLAGRDPHAESLVLNTRHGALPVIQLNHATSDIFCFEKIPYCLLTNHHFANTYAARFARNARLSATDWHLQFSTRLTDLTFVAETPPVSTPVPPPVSNPVSNPAPRGGIINLHPWRDQLAKACTNGVIERLDPTAQGWRTRFDLDNWHLDKITRLGDHTRVLAAFEDVHQTNYVSEALFDAFACGALPLYFAAHDHRIHEFDLPKEAWVNLFDRDMNMDVTEAADLIAEIRFTPERLAAYVQAQIRLAQLFDNPATWVNERQRLQQAVLCALTDVLDGI